MNHPKPQLETEKKALLESGGLHVQTARKLLATLEGLPPQDRTQTRHRLAMALKEHLETYEKELAPLLAPESKSSSDPMTKSKSGDHRIIPRFHQKHPIRFCEVGKESHWHKGYSHDVGAMGLFILSNRLEKVGQNLLIEIDIHDLGKLHMRGTVVWTKWVPPSLRMVEYTGFGVKISQAPESWFKYFLNFKS